MYKLYIIITLWCLLQVQPALSQIEEPKTEMRAAWVTTLYGLDWPSAKATTVQGRERQKEEFRLLLDQLKVANFNTILLHARGRGDTFYASDIEPWNKIFTGTVGRYPGYDPFQFAIEECHKRGMEVHAWIVAIPLGGKKHVAELGRQSIVSKHPEMCISASNDYYLNPGHPETKYYLAKMATEIVQKYDVDGIHLDYIRYPEAQVKFNDRTSFQRYGKGQSLKEWRRENITAIIREVHHSVKAIKPWIKVSSSPVGKYNDTYRYSSKGWNAYETVCQDAKAWLQEGIQDMIFPMMYFRDNNFFPFVLDWAENNYGRQIIPGLGTYFLEEANWPLDDIERQINVLRQLGIPGQAHFRARFITNNSKGVYNLLRNKLYTHPSLIPPMTWMDSIPPSVPTGLQVKHEGEKIQLKWDAAHDNTLDATVRYNIYASEHYPVDVNNGANLIAINLYGTNYIHECRDSRALTLNYAITSVDRFGNESRATQFTHMNSQDNLLLENDGITLKVPEHRKVFALYVTDLTGRKVKRYSDEEQISIADLPQGFYQIKASDKKGRLYLLGSFIK